MPCGGPELNHTDAEKESGMVLEFLKEIAHEKFDHDNPSYYGRVSTLDADTAKLCEFLKHQHPNAIRGFSLELQLWWRKHQGLDARRERQRIADAERVRLADAARAKLTPAERKSLGLK